MACDRNSENLMMALNRSPRLKIMRLPHAEGLALPAYQSARAAGLDLVAAVPDRKPITLQSGASVMVPTGLIMELPVGFEGQVRPRSGLAARHGVTVLNSPGTIDADYRGEVQVLLVNHGPKPFRIARGERIAQLVVAPVSQVRIVLVSTLSATERGAGGFGSTGGINEPRKTTKKSKGAPTPSPRAKKRSSKAV